MEEIDREASIFAQCLLMPEEQLRAEHAKAIKRGEKGERLVKKLSEKFRVPVESMWMRLADLHVAIPI